MPALVSVSSAGCTGAAGSVVLQQHAGDGAAGQAPPGLCSDTPKQMEPKLYGPAQRTKQVDMEKCRRVPSGGLLPFASLPSQRGICQNQDYQDQELAHSILSIVQCGKRCFLGSSLFFQIYVAFLFSSAS